VRATFTVQTACSATQANATWGVSAKQSNDFSGQPGNGFLPGTTDLQPLGSFSVGLSPAQPMTGTPFTVTVTALDTCGFLTKSDYNGLGAYAGFGLTFPPTALSGATFGALSAWSHGAASETITPAVAQSGNTVTATDATSGITKTVTFSVLDTVCPTGNCHFGSNGNTIQIDSKVPPGDALGLGFNPNVVSGPGSTYACGTSTSAVGGLAALIAPSGYDPSVPYTLTLTYSNALTNGRPVSSFVFCLSDNGAAWSIPLPACPVLAPNPCVISQKRVPGGALQIVLRLYSNDPYGGLS
jgi:hypothetical protein